MTGFGGKFNEVSLQAKRIVPVSIQSFFLGKSDIRMFFFYIVFELIVQG